MNNIEPRLGGGRRIDTSAMEPGEVRRVMPIHGEVVWPCESLVGSALGMAELIMVGNDTEAPIFQAGYFEQDRLMRLLSSQSFVALYEELVKFPDVGKVGKWLELGVVARKLAERIGVANPTYCSVSLDYAFIRRGSIYEPVVVPEEGYVQVEWSGRWKAWHIWVGKQSWGRVNLEVIKRRGMSQGLVMYVQTDVPYHGGRHEPEDWGNVMLSYRVVGDGTVSLGWQGEKIAFSIGGG